MDCCTTPLNICIIYTYEQYVCSCFALVALLKIAPNLARCYLLGMPTQLPEAPGKCQCRPVILSVMNIHSS